jgi:YHS domain-containing protein
MTVPIQCEICGSGVIASHARAHVEVPGRTCYFCCDACRRTFHEHPDLYPEAVFLRTTPDALASAAYR